MSRWIRHRCVSYHPLALELKPVAQCAGCGLLFAAAGYIVWLAAR
jgi:hypothetical protein